MPDVKNWEIVGLVVDLLFVYVINRFYKSRVKDADLISNAETCEVGEELKKTLSSAVDKSIPYACVVGATKAASSPLRSAYTETVGVVQHQMYVEHKSKRTQGFWADVRNVIKDQLNIRPFLLVSDDGQWSVEVQDALSAEYLRESLAVVHDQYQPSQNNLLSRGLDRLFGEVTKGYQETERMLGIGVPLLGIGKLMLVGGNRVVLTPPDDSKRYILTTSSKRELIASLKSVARSLNVARWLFGVAGVALLAFIVHRNLRKYKSEYRSRRLLNELRLHRQMTRSDDDCDATGTSLCIICLSLQRDVVLLNCGHICICGECAVALPEPKICPVCRGNIDRIVPTYIS